MSASLPLVGAGAVGTGEGPEKDLALKHFCSPSVLHKQEVKGQGPS